MCVGTSKRFARESSPEGDRRHTLDSTIPGHQKAKRKTETGAKIYSDKRILQLVVCGVNSLIAETTDLSREKCPPAADSSDEDPLILRPQHHVLNENTPRPQQTIQNLVDDMALPHLYMLWDYDGILSQL